jgi:hypothetical protein
MEAVFSERRDSNSYCLYQGFQTRGQEARQFILCSPYYNFILITGCGFMEFKSRGSHIPGAMCGDQIVRVVPNICGPSVQEVTRVALLAPRLLL